MNSLPKAVTRQRRDCDLNPDPSVPESSTLTTRLPSHPLFMIVTYNDDDAESEVSDTCVRNSLLSCRVISLEGLVSKRAVERTRLSQVNGTLSSTTNSC